MQTTQVLPPEPKTDLETQWRDAVGADENWDIIHRWTSDPDPIAIAKEERKYTFRRAMVVLVYRTLILLLLSYQTWIMYRFFQLWNQ